MLCYDEDCRIGDYVDRWIKITALGLFTVAWLAAAFTYMQSMKVIGHQYVPDVRQLVAVTDADSLAEGERLAHLYGCASACHGERMQGGVVYEHALNGRLVAPNLTHTVRERTLPELEAIVRQGIKPDGTSVFGMPSASFAAMTDQDLSAVLAYVRAAPEESFQPGESDFGLLTRYRMVTGAVPAQATLGFQQPWRETFRGNEVRLGEYLASVTCTQCHGLDLNGDGDSIPSLRIINDYDEFEFIALMKDGTGRGEIPVIGKVQMSSDRFSRLTEAEVKAIYHYLRVRP